MNHMTRTLLPRSIMRAIRVHSFGGPEVLRLESNVPVPELGPNQVLVRLASAGVNPVDTYVRSGMTHASSPDSLPYVPGGDGAGIIEAVGAQVLKNNVHLRVGQRVFTVFRSSGTYAELAAVDEHLVYPLADRLTFSQGAAIGVPYFTAYRALVQKLPSTLPRGSTVLIHGASGSVGLAAVQLAVNKGYTVFGTVGTPQGERVVLESGANRVFCHRKPNYLDEIKSATKNKGGVDVIVEMLANVNLANDLDLLAENGRVLVVGNRGPLEINPRALMTKETSIVGVGLTLANKVELAELTDMIQEGIKDGWINPIVSKEYPLAEAAQAHRDVIESSGATGKLVLTI